MTLKMDSNNYLNILLGKDSSPVHVVSSISFVVILFFYIFSFGSYFHVDISSFENRINYHKSFLTYIIEKNVDQLVIVSGTIIWLFTSLLNRLKTFIPMIYGGIMIITTIMGSSVFDISILSSLPLILSLIICNHFTSTKILKIERNLHLNYLAIFLTVLTIVSFTLSLFPILSSQLNKKPLVDYAYFIFLLFSSASPTLISFFILGSPIKLVFSKLVEKLKTEQLLPSLYSNQKSNNVIMYVVFIMFLAVLLSLIPHNPVINSNNQVVSADSADYVTMVRNLQETKNLQDFANQTFVTIQGGDRPFTLIFLYVIAKIIPTNLSYTIDHLPVILTPLLVLSTFVLTREITSNDRVSLFAAFLTAVSFQTLIGVYGGLFSNLFSLVIGYFSLAFLFKFLKKSSKINFVIFTSLMVIFVFSHVYTWTVLTLVMSVFLIFMYKMNYYDRKRIIFLFLVIIFTVTIDISRTLLTNAHGGIVSDTALASSGAGIGQLFLSWNTLVDTMQNYAGGQLGNFIIFVLAIYWLLKTNLRNTTGVFLTVFISIGMLPLLFGNGVIQSRVFYDIPFQIPAAIALTYLSKKSSGIMLVLPVCIWLLTISLRMVTNFYYVSP